VQLRGHCSKGSIFFLLLLFPYGHSNRRRPSAQFPGRFGHRNSHLPARPMGYSPPQRRYFLPPSPSPSSSSLTLASLHILFIRPSMETLSLLDFVYLINFSSASLRIAWTKTPLPKLQPSDSSCFPHGPAAIIPSTNLQGSESTLHRPTWGASLPSSSPP
jgi:hypothetical protein